VDSGIFLTGGGSQIAGLREYIEEIATVPVYLSEAPLTAVVDGCKKLLKMTNKYFYTEV